MICEKSPVGCTFATFIAEASKLLHRCFIDIRVFPPPESGFCLPQKGENGKNVDCGDFRKKGSAIFILWRPVAARVAG